MSDKRRRRSFFEDVLDDDDFRDIEDIIEHMMERFGVDLDDLSRQPFVYGFSISQRPGEEPEINEFGSMLSPDEDRFTRPQMRVDERKPFIDVCEIDGSVHVTAELPGIEKEEIELRATEDSLNLVAVCEEQKYDESIKLPATVDPDSGKATYRNGVLEVILEKKDFGRQRPVRID
ncbi:archaeal heat shock protein Hsp20 [Methanolobus chelungpuianus]|uniref:Molecular chaperone Hsp20 n=1 Tax=Methanolobus chelungpuianus TaxID=502115 RepID=A0AAE3KWL0_9EURY|nr:archaeal heat shock protein Hsp20 [Methanolobus chelungpuianus]MCQ6962227.1 molecular chaperone Hsp20 [Methanolobus chelungpuianus]